MALAFRVKQMEKIVASIKYGRYFNKAFRTIIIVDLALSLLLFLIAIGLLIIDLSRDSVMVFIGATIFSVLNSIVWISFILKQKRFDKDLKEWQKDFEKTYADVSITFEYISMFKHKYIMRAEFEAGGVWHVVEREVGDAFNYVDKALKQCVGYKVPIYYSATYDEIVFIKKT